MNFILKRENDLLILSSKTQQISENSLETTSETLFPFSEPVYSMMNFLNQENFSISEFKCNLQKQDLNLYPLKVHIAVTVPIVDHQEHH